jgi:prepilin signal peptidase PulO-like enzyme (type II secretory pathway)
VGSFLNVVIYRLPAGMSIVRPGSHCPACGHPIRWFDNIPVLSWLLLRRRCRDCRAPISARYPLVEAATAILFLVLAQQEVFHGAANLPVRPPQPFSVYAYHLLLLCTLLAAALIAWDGKRAPTRLFLPALAVGLLAPLAWPDLHPVPAWQGIERPWLAGLVDGIAGLAAGWIVGQVANLPRHLLVGRVFQPVQKGADGLENPSYGCCGTLETYPTAAACVGVFLGWQAAVVIGLVATAFHLALRLARPNRFPAVAWVGIGTLLWLLNWARITAWWSGILG